MVISDRFSLLAPRVPANFNRNFERDNSIRPVLSVKRNVITTKPVDRIHRPKFNPDFVDRHVSALSAPNVQQTQSIKWGNNRPANYSLSPNPSFHPPNINASVSANLLNQKNYKNFHKMRFITNL